MEAMPEVDRNCIHVSLNLLGSLIALYHHKEEQFVMYSGLRYGAFLATKFIFTRRAEHVISRLLTSRFACHHVQILLSSLELL